MSRAMSNSRATAMLGQRGSTSRATAQKHTPQTTVKSRSPHIAGGASCSLVSERQGKLRPLRLTFLGFACRREDLDTAAAQICRAAVPGQG